MAVLFERDVLEIYTRNNAYTLEMHRRTEKWLLGVLPKHDRPDQFVVKYSDGKFYPVSSRSKAVIEPAEIGHTKGQPPMSKFGVRCDIEGFDTLEQATLWWDTCSQ